MSVSQKGKNQLKIASSNFMHNDSQHQCYQIDFTCLIYTFFSRTYCRGSVQFNRDMLSNCLSQAGRFLNIRWDIFVYKILMR